MGYRKLTSEEFLELKQANKSSASTWGNDSFVSMKERTSNIPSLSSINQKVSRNTATEIKTKKITRPMEKAKPRQVEHTTVVTNEPIVRRTIPKPSEAEYKNSIDINNQRIDVLRDSREMYVQQGNWEEVRKTENEIKRLNELISDTKNGFYKQNVDFEKNGYESVVNYSNFDKYSKAGALIENPKPEERVGISIGGWMPFSPEVKNKVEYTFDDPLSAMMGKPGTESKYLKMTDKERAIYNYYIAKEGEKKADDYLKLIDRDLDMRASQDMGKSIGDMSNKNKAFGVGLNIVSAPMGVGGLLEAGKQNIKNAITGKYEPVNQYAPAFSGVNIEESTREGITRDMTPVQSFFANTGLSMGQSMTQMPMGKIPSLLTMAGNAAGHSAKDIANRGGTTGEVLLGSLASGGIEYATERLPLESLYGLKDAPPATIKAAVKAILKQAGIEATEETVAEYSNALADIENMGSKSQFEIYKRQLKDNNISPEEAQKQALKEFFVLRPLQAAAGGAISGGALGGGSIALGKGLNAMNQKVNTNINKESNVTEAEPEQGISEPKQYVDEVANIQSVDIPENIVSEKYEANGQKAFKSNYDKVVLDERLNGFDEEQTPAMYESQFDKFYNFGRTNMPIENVKKAESFILGDIVKLKAYYAGVNDYKAIRQTSLENKLKTIPEQGGFDVKNSSKNVTQEQRVFSENIGKLTGLKISVVDELPFEANGVYKREKGSISISLNSDSFLGATGHELTHYIKDYATEDYYEYRDFVLQKTAQIEGLDFEGYVKNYENRYADKLGKFTREQVFDEMAADASQKVFADEVYINEVVKTKPTLAKRIADFFGDVMESLKALINKGDTYSRFAEEINDNIDTASQIRDKWFKALGRAVTSETVMVNEGETEQYSLNPKFAEEYDKWDGKNTRIHFNVGNTSKALQSIGVKEKKIIWDSAKIIKTKNKHLYMTDEIIKQVPNILENPIIVMQSKNKGFESRITMFGEVYDDNGLPIMAVMELTPTGYDDLALNELKVASIYSRRDKTDLSNMSKTQSTINSSEILYVNPNEKRTNTWFSQNGLQLPVAITKYGSIQMIQYDGEKVKGIRPNILNEEVGKTALQQAFKKAGLMTDEKFSEQYNPTEKYNNKDSEFSFKENKENQITYDSLIGKPDIKIVKMLDVKKGLEKRSILNAARESVISKNNPKNTDKQMYIYNRDINSNILIGRKGIEHGLRRNSDIIAYVEQYLGDYLENSVKINELIPQDENAVSAYLLLGLGIDNEDIKYPVYFVINQFEDGTNELAIIDVLYSVNTQKIESAVKTAKGNVNKDISFSDSLISVSDLLDIVNEIYSDILPESVAKKYGNERRNSKLGNSVVFSLKEIDKTLPKPGISPTKLDALSTLKSNIPQKDKEYNRQNAVINEKDTNNKFSLKETDETNYKKLERENQELKERNELLKAQFKLTEGVKHSKSDIIKLAGNILEKYSSQYDKSILVDNIQRLVDYIGNAEQVDFNEVMEMTSSMAREVLNQSLEENKYMYEEYKSLRQEIRKTKFRLSEQDRKDLDVAGGYNQFKKDNFGRFMLSSNEGISVDSFFTEKSQMYPEFFDAEQFTNPAEQIMQISDIYNSLQPEYINPYGINMDEVAADLAYEIYDSYFDISQEKPTFADRKQKEFENLRREYKRKLQENHKVRQEAFDEVLKEVKLKNENNKERMQKKIDEQEILKNNANERTREVRSRLNEKLKEAEWLNVERLAEQKERLQAKIKYQQDLRKKLRTKMNESTDVKKYKSRILKNVNEMSKRLIHPTDSKHIPESLRKTVSEFLLTIDFSSGKTNINGEPSKFSNVETARSNKWRDLKKIYENISRDSGNENDVFADFDPDLVKRLDEFTESTREIKLNDMNAEQLKELSLIVEAVKHSIRDYDMLLSDKNKRRVSEVALGYMNEKSGDDTRIEKANVLKIIDDIFRFDMLDAPSYFNMFGDTVYKSVYKNLRKGFDQKIRNTAIAESYMKGLLKDVNIKGWTGKEAKSTEFTTTGGKIKLTPAQVMSLYLHSKREQSEGHLLGGGVKQAPTIKTINSKGIKHSVVEKSFSPVKLTMEDMGKMVDTLTTEQKKMAEDIAEFFKNQTSAWGNEVSMQMYGYKKFTEENYFPIVSDSNYITSIDGSQNDRTSTLRNMGSTKNTVKNAKNPIILEDIFDVFVRQADQMGSYNAFVVPLSDMQKFLNFKVKSSKESAYLGSVKQTMERTMGTGAQGYFKTLMEDVNGSWGHESSGLQNLLIGNMKAAAVGANLRVIVQQPTSIVRAANMIKPKYLSMGITKSIARKNNYELMNKYAPITQWKDWGFYEMDTGRQMKEIFMGTKGLTKLRELSMKGAGFADKITWGAIWNGVELEVKEKQKNLEYGSDEFYKTVGERFSEIIDKTQVVDSVLHRSQIMRSKDLGKKMATSFMSEPTKTYNMLRNSVVKYNQNRTSENKIQIAKTMGILIASGIITALAASSVDMFRDDDDDETLTEKFMQAAFGDYSNAKNFKDYAVAALTSNVGDNLNPMNFLPLFKELSGMIEGFDPVRTDMSGVLDICRSASKWFSYFEGNSAFTVTYLIKDGIESLSKLLGVPLKNMDRTVTNLKNAVVNYMCGLEVQYVNDKFKFDIGAEKNVPKYVKMMVEARLDSKTELATKIYNEMVANGIPNKKINSKIESQMKTFIVENEEIAELSKARSEADLTRINKLQNDLKSKGYSDEFISFAVKSYEKTDEEEEEDTFKSVDNSFWDIPDEDTEHSVADYTVLFNSKRLGKTSEFNQLYSHMKVSGKKESEIMSGLLTAQNEWANENGEQEISYDALFEIQLEKGENSAEYKNISKSLLEYGKTEKGIEGAMNSRINKIINEYVKARYEASNGGSSDIYNETRELLKKLKYSRFKLDKAFGEYKSEQEALKQ